MPVFHQGPRHVVFHGNCMEVLRALDADSVDSIVTDPPYDLTAGKKGGTGLASVNLNSPYGRSRISTGNGGFMGKDWDATGIAFDPELWAEALRVLKPGGHLLAFGGSRTWHRLAVAVEDAGFEIRDSIAWLYGSGFPKSLDVSKAIDKAAGADREVIGLNPHARPNRSRANGVYEGGDHEAANVTTPATDAAQQWQGWGTALKPAFEPIVVGRKPIKGTVAANVLEHGTGALNIDGCRVGSDVMRESRMTQSAGGVLNANGRDVEHGNWKQRPNDTPAEHSGRWPTNVVLDESQAAELDRQSGYSRSPTGPVKGQRRKSGVMGAPDGNHISNSGHGDSGGASRFFPVFKYQAKAPAKERPKVDGVAHPTVKPLELMRWLVKLVTPPGGTVLEPFAGSGTTVEAALLEGFKCFAIEREPDYLPLILQRIERSCSDCEEVA